MSDLYGDVDRRYTSTNYINCFAYMADLSCFISGEKQCPEDLCLSVCKSCPRLAAASVTDDRQKIPRKYIFAGRYSLKENRSIYRIYQ